MLSILAAVVLLSASAQQIQRDSTYLADGMTRDQVVAKLGNPDEVELDVCGQSTPRPWRCYAWTYWQDDHQRSLRVLFGQRETQEDHALGFVPDDAWQVILWRVR